MKHLLILCFLCGCAMAMQAQEKLPFNHPVCDTRVSDTGYYMRNAAEFLRERRALGADKSFRSAFSSPYVIRVFIRIVRESNGTLPGCSIATAIQNFNEMNGQYTPHNICFQLMGIDFINDSYLNNFVYDSLLHSDYVSYIRNNNLDVDGAMTIFIHNRFVNSGSSGNAYGIPNNFLSVARWAAESNDVRSIFGHEMGHCLGLYHTFEQYRNIQESVTRNTSSNCYNCKVDGDLCCDTPADYTNSQDYTNGTTCTYSRNLANSCDNLQYSPSAVNIMSYQPWTCISITGTAITADQETRMHAAIVDINKPIYSRVAEDALILSGNTGGSSNQVRVYSARTYIAQGFSATVSQTGSSKAYYAAGSFVVFSSGTTFAPGSTGVVNISINGCN